MSKETLSGTVTPFTDKKGTPIKVHDYIRDGEGNRYYVNSHCQAVPEECDAPAVELKTLVESSEVTVMGVEELLDIDLMKEKRHRGGRRKKAVEAPVSLMPEESPSPDNGTAKEPVKEPAKDDLFPVSMTLVLSSIPDDALADELRRRGYTLCAVKPALITV